MEPFLFCLRNLSLNEVLQPASQMGKGMWISFLPQILDLLEDPGQKKFRMEMAGKVEIVHCLPRLF